MSSGLEGSTVGPGAIGRSVPGPTVAGIWGLHGKARVAMGTEVGVTEKNTFLKKSATDVYRSHGPWAPDSFDGGTRPKPWKYDSSQTTRQLRSRELFNRKVRLQKSLSVSDSPYVPEGTHI